MENNKKGFKTNRRNCGVDAGIVKSFQSIFERRGGEAAKAGEQERMAEGRGETNCTQE